MQCHVLISKKMKNYLLILYNKALGFLTPIIIIMGFYFFYSFVVTPKIYFFLRLILCPYLIPLFIYRITFAFIPLKEGAFYIESDSDIAWQMSYKIQSIYGAIPQLEKFLISLGLFSFWLRMWGSKIGKNVFWTSHTQVLDRNGLVVGNFVFFGHESVLTSHITNFKHGKAIIYFKKIKIGNHVFVGARSKIAPGVQIDDGVKLPFEAMTRINQKINAKTFNTDDMIWTAKHKVHKNEKRKI